MSLSPLEVRGIYMYCFSVDPVNVCVSMMFFLCAQYLFNWLVDVHQTCRDIPLGIMKLISIWWPWPCFQGWHVPKNKFLIHVFLFDTPPHNSGGILCFSLLVSICSPVCLPICLPVFLSALGFHSLTWIVFNEFYPDLAYTYISGGSGLGLLMGKFHQFLTAFSACCMSMFGG